MVWSAHADVTLARKNLSQRFKMAAMTMHALRAYMVSPEGHSNRRQRYDVMAMVAIGSISAALSVPRASPRMSGDERGLIFRNSGW